MSPVEPSSSEDSVPVGSPDPDRPALAGSMADQVVLRVVSKALIPFMILFGLYVITHGEVGPGGGFQGGVICAAGFILYGLIFGRDALARVLPHVVVDLLTAFGVLFYAGVGVASMLTGGNFLDYTVLIPSNPGLGLSLVEYGVGITVCFTMITIFNKISEPSLLPDSEAESRDGR